jgi:predicted  nucleic acid-binding Zn-ribbon protein
MTWNIDESVATKRELADVRAEVEQLRRLNDDALQRVRQSEELVEAANQRIAQSVAAFNDLQAQNERLQAIVARLQFLEQNSDLRPFADIVPVTADKEKLHQAAAAIRQAKPK